MTHYKFGTVVLLNFPHTDLQQSSKRPALVIYDEGDKDIVVARITSQRYSGKNDHAISEWKNVGLLFPSWVRAGKLATLDKQLIIRLSNKQGNKVELILMLSSTKVKKAKNKVFRIFSIF
jgi:mRNA interferase MazF